MRRILFTRRYITQVLFLFVFYYSSSAQTGSSKADSLIEILQHTTDDTLRMNLLQRIGGTLLPIDPAKAEQYFQELLLLAESTDHNKWKGDALMGKGNSWYYRGDFNKARIQYQEAGRIAKEAGDSSRYALSLNNIGLTYINQGDLSAGLDYHLRSSATMERIHDTRGLGLNYNAIGVIYLELGQIHHNDAEVRTGLDYFKRSLSLCEKNEALSTVMTSVLNNIGNAYVTLKEFDKALEYIIRSLEHSRKTGNKSAEATALSNFGSVFLEQKIYDKAENYLLQALSIHRELNDIHGQGNNLHMLATVNLRSGDKQKAKKYWEQSLPMLIEAGELSVLSEVYKGLSTVAASMGDHKTAYDLYLKHDSLKDSLSNQEYARNLNEMKTKFDMETQVKENELLKKEAELRNEQLAGQKKTIYAISAGMTLLILLVFFVYKGYRDKRRANTLLEIQKRTIEEKNKDITDSIRYASRIQSATLPSVDKRNNLLGDHFIFFRPRDIVSGDFYWLEKQGDNIYAAVADCTGHGVPGALMSMIGSGILTDILSHESAPAPGRCLDLLREKVIKALEQQDGDAQKDGMDIALIVLEKGNRSLLWAGGNNALWHCRNGLITEHSPDKMPVGSHSGDPLPFQTKKIDIQPGDRIYLFTDGFADQFGGEAGKKFKYKPLKELLEKTSILPSKDQSLVIEKAFLEWKGELEQVDDVCIMGICC